jgi:branched-chain amino acid transport system substrate-binding protein
MTCHPSVRPPPRRFRGAAALLLSLGTLTAACGGADGGEVVFGLAGPLQESYGQSTLQGAHLALKHVNESPELLPGRRLRLEEADDQASGHVAVGVAERFVDDPQVVAVAGHVNSGTTIQAAHRYDGELPALATTATSPQVSALGDWIFRIASSDSANAVQLAQTTRRMADRVAVLYANDAYGQGLAAAFGDALRAAGGTVVEADPYLETTQDFRPYLRRMQRRGVGMVFIAGLEDGAARIIQQSLEVGLQARFIGGDGLEGLVAMGADFDGTMVGLLFHPDANAQAREFAAAFQAEYGQTPNSFAAAAYDAVMLLAHAAHARGADRRGIREYLAGVGRPGGTPEYRGVTGAIRFDANGDPENKDFAVGVIRTGTIQLSGDNR